MAGETGPEVQVDLDSLEAYLKGVLVPLQQHVVQIRADLGAMPVMSELFGPMPYAKQLEETHRWAYDVYAPTVSALGDDVAMLIDKLGTVIRNYRDQDDSVEAALQKLARNLSGDGGYTADDTFDRTRAEAGGDPALLAPPPPSGGIPIPGGAPPAPPPPAAPPPAEPSGPAPSGGRDLS